MTMRRRDFMGTAAALVAVLASGAGLTGCASNRVAGFKPGEVIGRIRLNTGEQRTVEQAIQAILEMHDLNPEKREQLRGMLAIATCDDFDAESPLKPGKVEALSGTVVSIYDSSAGSYTGRDADILPPTERYISGGITWYFFVLETNEVEKAASSEQVEATAARLRKAGNEVTYLDASGLVTTSTARAHRVVGHIGRLREAA